MSVGDDHYLREELYALVQSGPTIFDFLQAGSLDGLWYWDLEQTEQEWMSPRFWELFGVDPSTKKHLASEWQDQVHREDLEVALRNFHVHLEDPSHTCDQVVRYRHEDGSTVWVRCRAIAIHDESGQPVRLLGCHNDVTGLKQAQQKLAGTMRELQHTANDLEQANRELESFTYTVAHDLEAPLRAIDGFTRILVEEHVTELGEDGRRVTSVLRDNVARMVGLINDLLTFSRVGRQELARTSVEPEPLVRTTLGALTDGQPDREIRLEITEALPTVFADRALLRQVFENLLSNAVKFSRPREVAVIEVGGECREGEDVLWVRDNGVGFDMTYVGKLFGVFERLHYADDFPGSGAGLAIVQRIMNRHGGRIWAESELDRGATFHLAFPQGGGVCRDL